MAEIAIRVAESLGPVLVSWDAALRDELIKHVEAVASNPAGMLRRGGPDEPFSTYVSSFRADYDPALEIRVAYVGFDAHPPQPVIVFVDKIMHPDDR